LLFFSSYSHQKKSLACLSQRNGPAQRFCFLKSADNCPLIYSENTESTTKGQFFHQIQKLRKGSHVNAGITIKGQILLRADVIAAQRIAQTQQSISRSVWRTAAAGFKWKFEDLINYG